MLSYYNHILNKIWEYEDFLRTPLSKFSISVWSLQIITLKKNTEKYSQAVGNYRNNKLVILAISNCNQQAVVQLQG